MIILIILWFYFKEFIYSLFKLILEECLRKFMRVVYDIFIGCFSLKLSNIAMKTTYIAYMKTI